MAQNQNFSQFASKLRAAAAEFRKEVESIVEINIGDMTLMATRDAPGPADQIRTQGGSESEQNIRQSRSAKGSTTPISQAITYKLSNGRLTGTLQVSDTAGPFAIWIEFGTGQSASSYVPTLPPEMQAVARKYYINGKGTIINSPYVYPAFMKYKEQFVKDLKAAIQNSFKTV